MTELEELVDLLAQRTKGYIDREISALKAAHAVEVADLRAKLSALPAGPAGPKGEDGSRGADGVDGRDGRDVSLDDVVARVLGLIPIPKDGRDAAPVDYGHIGEIIKAAAINAVAEIPRPKDGEAGRPGEKGDPGIAGRDAEVDYDKVGDIIALAVSKEVGKIPIPKDGAPGLDANEDAIVARVLAAVPVPKDGSAGKDADEDAIVARVLAAVPAAKDGEPGKDADPEFVRQEVERAIEAKIGALPRPRDGVDGKDADPAQIVAAVDSAVAKAIADLPRPSDGKNGKDADPEFVRAEIERAIARIPRPKDGESVHPDTVALMIREALEKAVSEMRLPEDGPPGRDALDIDILDSIEEGRSYAIGTFARHDGGLVKATRHTDPIERGLADSGWTVIVDGLKGLEIEPTSDGRIRVALTRTSGAADVREVPMPVVNIDRGVWKAGESYRAGQGVTHDGSFWIAQRDGGDKPGTSSAWRLAVKKGRDAK